MQPFPVLKACDLVAASDQLHWLVHDLLRAHSCAIIGGAPKSCKTWLALDLAVAVASATPCLGRESSHTPRPVLLFTAEESPSFVKQRLLSLALHHVCSLDARPLFVLAVDLLRLDLPEHQRRLRDTLSSLQPTLLVLDPLVRLHAADENHAQQMAELLGFLRALQRSEKTTVLLVHHAAKHASRFAPGHALRGSSDLYAWADTVLSLSRSRAGIHVTAEHRNAPAPPPFAFRLSGSSHPCLLPADRDEPPPSSPDLPQRILFALRLHGAPLPRHQLRAMLKIRNDSLGPALDLLLARGDLSRSNLGLSLTPASFPPPTTPSGTEQLSLSLSKTY